MKQAVMIIVIVLLFAATVILAFNLLEDITRLVESNLPGIQTELSKKIFAPPPIKSLAEHPDSYLTKEGVLSFTNIQRQNNNIPSLKENAVLDLMALAKVEDMFANQYFAHQSPSGKGVGDLAEDFSYQFIIVGENLALGGFKDDEALVTAWMESPGHRENILNKAYQEIGIAVKKGVFEGKEVWLAVQHFGLSSGACPTIDQRLKISIDGKETQISLLKQELSALESEIKEARKKGYDREEYGEKIGEYNILVGRYNDLINENKSLINIYNIQVNIFNNCVSGFLQ